MVALVAAVLLWIPAAGWAGSVSGSSGAFVQSIPVAVPAFRGLEPTLVLGYSSQGGNGFAGVGWGLGGFGVVERAGPGLGSPRYDATDVFVLDGRELVPCPAPNASPSCSTGGTHTTKQESYLKVRFETATNTWTVWRRDGTRTVYASTYVTPSGTLRWGQASTTDTHGNVVTYTWSCPSGEDCYPESVQFGPYSVTLYRETRPDVTSAATGHVGTLRQVRARLRSILVRYGSAPVRAYALGYATSGVTSRSLLTSVRQYGKDVVIDAAGAISGGTSLPPHVFEYQADGAGHTFQPWGE